MFFVHVCIKCTLYLEFTRVQILKYYCNENELIPDPNTSARNRKYFLFLPVPVTNLN